MAGRKASSRRWLARQERDPYVARARAHGYRSRAAFKLAELDDRFRLLAPGRAVVDLGAAPGGWSQIAAERVGPRGRVVAVDRLPLAPLRGVERLALDLSEAGAEAALRTALPQGADAVLSDAAPAATGHRATDALRAGGLSEAAAALARALLVPGGGIRGQGAARWRGRSVARAPAAVPDGAHGEAAGKPCRLGGDVRRRPGVRRVKLNEGADLLRMPCRLSAVTTNTQDPWMLAFASHDAQCMDLRR